MTYGIPDELYPLMEALNLLLIPQGHSYLTGVFTSDLVLWPFLLAIAIAEQKLKLRQSSK